MLPAFRCFSPLRQPWKKAAGTADQAGVCLRNVHPLGGDTSQNYSILLEEAQTWADYDQPVDLLANVAATISGKAMVASA